MSKRNPKLLLGDILEAIEKIKSYTHGLTFEAFLDDPKTCDAVIRNFEITGEASNRLPEDFKENNHSVDWFRIIGFRNRIVHDYMGVDYKIVWTTVQKDLDKLSKDIQHISKEL